ISAVLDAVVQAVVRTTASSSSLQLTPSPDGQISSAQLHDFLSAVLTYVVPLAAVIIVVAFLAQGILSGLLTGIMGRGVLGRRVTLAEAWSVGRIGPVLGAALLLVGVGLAVAVPFAVLGGGLAVLLALNNAGPGAALVAVLGSIGLIVAELIVQV